LWASLYGEDINKLSSFLYQCVYCIKKVDKIGQNKRFFFTNLFISRVRVVRIEVLTTVLVVETDSAVIAVVVAAA